MRRDYQLDRQHEQLSNLRILVVAPNRVTQEGIRTLLTEHDSHLHIGTQATDADEAVATARRIVADVTLVDSSLANTTIELLHMRDSPEAIRTTVISVVTGEPEFTRLAAFAEAGVNAIVTPDDNLATTIADIHLGWHTAGWVSPTLGATLLRSTDTEQHDIATRTPRGARTD